VTQGAAPQLGERSSNFPVAAQVCRIYAFFMAISSTAELQAWIDRLNAGDQTARDELIRHACARLRLLVGKMMQKYDRLQRWVDIDDILQSAIVRLLRAMGSTPVNSVQDFFSLAALQIRRELIDLCRHYFGPHGVGANHESARVDGSPQGDWRPLVEPAGTDENQQELAFWKDFHLLIERLPAGERCVFDLVWYHGMTQTEASMILGLSEAKVKRLWVAARDQLKTSLGGRLPD
jgi:RNA polymerase sigma factor (sigma-70 family)